MREGLYLTRMLLKASSDGARRLLQRQAGSSRDVLLREIKNSCLNSRIRYFSAMMSMRLSMIRYTNDCLMLLKGDTEDLFELFTLLSSVTNLRNAKTRNSMHFNRKQNVKLRCIRIQKRVSVFRYGGEKLRRRTDILFKS